jgi:hypothetical protein
VGLNDNYNVVRSQLLTAYPLPNLNQVYSTVLADEKQKNAYSKQNLVKDGDSVVFNAVKPKGNDKREKLYCNNYKRNGHTRERCYYLISFPPGHKLHRKVFNKKGKNVNACSTDQNEISGNPLEFLNPHQIKKLTQLLNINKQDNVSPNYCNMAGRCSFFDNDDAKWVIDNRATDHITYNKDLYNNFKILADTVTVGLPNNDSVVAAGIANVNVTGNFMLSNVLYIPNFNINLMSVAQTIDDLNCIIQFAPDTCIIQDLMTGKQIGVADRKKHLYILDGKVERNQAICSHVSNVVFDI